MAVERAQGLQPVRPVRGRRPARRATPRCVRRSSARAPSGRSTGCVRPASSPRRPRPRRTRGARSATSRGCGRSTASGTASTRSSSIPAGTGCSTARSRAASTPCRGRTRDRARTSPARRSSSVWTHANAGVMCPVSMTYSAVPALRVDPAIAAEWEPRLIAGELSGHGDDREAGRLRRAREPHAGLAGRGRLVRAARPQVVLLLSALHDLPRARAGARRACRASWSNVARAWSSSG